MRNSNSCLITFLEKYRSSYRKCKSSHRRCSVKNFSQTSQENTFFQEKSFKKRLQHKSFSVKFGKLLRTPILTNICKCLLPKMSLWNWEKLKFIHKKLFWKKKTGFLNINIRKKFMILISWSVPHEDFFDGVRNNSNY